MHSRHETVFDDNLIQLHFSIITSSNELLLAHWHEHMEILFIIDGTITAYINETSYYLQKGDILVVNPKDIHYTHAHKDCHYGLLQIPPAHLDRICRNRECLHFTEYIPHTGAENDLNASLNDIFDEMNRLHKQTEEDGGHLLFLARLYSLLYLLYKKNSHIISTQSLGKNQRDFQRMEQCMRYVWIHYREEITLSDIADLLSITPEHFCRLFKKYTGQTFFTYLGQVRMMHFYQDLTQTDKTITFLLEQNGIRNYKAFLKSFKKIYGASPHQVRKETALLQQIG